MSLDAQDRQFLVTLMAEWNQPRADARGIAPQSSEAKRLHLSWLEALWMPWATGIRGRTEWIWNRGGI